MAFVQLSVLPPAFHGKAALILQILQLKIKNSAFVHLCFCEAAGVFRHRNQRFRNALPPLLKLIIQLGAPLVHAQVAHGQRRRGARNRLLCQLYNLR